MDSHSIVVRLRARYESRALEPGTLFLLNAQDALQFLEEAHREGLAVAGVEGFSVTDTGAYQPRQEFSNDRADFGGSQERFVEETKNLIRRGAPGGIRFQVVVEEAA